ncbi:hypothetical protein A9Q83_04700 [Alphaproteobacteria bacterium 46_93_T64]|nr:hypothetical protein A9Q83_04700 [Alphaproteobacteria bacterium 46_93_T64]
MTISSDFNTSDQPINVLIVDDDKVDRKLVKRLLNNVENCDYLIDEAKSFSTACAFIESKTYDVALIDYVLGAETGVQLIRELTNQNILMPCIMLTSMNSSECDNLALEAGASDFLSKDDLSSRSLERVIRYTLHRAQLSKLLDHLAYHDVLTGLINRSLFLDRINHANENAIRYSLKHTLIFVDIDYFKLINDEHGHATGDTVLKEVSKRLVNCVRKVDTVARFGGDEFVILLEDTDSAFAHLVAQRILNSMETPIYVGNIVLTTRLSLGMTCFPTEECSTENALAEADRALCRAKQEGRNTYRSFNEEQFLETKRALRLENDLEIAIRNKKLSVHYQPQINIRTGLLRGFEALARWHHPELGWIPPDEFIPIAEKLSLIPDLFLQILEMACTQQMRWEQSRPGLIVTVNVSATQCASQNLINTLDIIVGKTGIDYHNLELELTESAVLAHPEKCLAILKSISEKDVRLAIDDFGTGFSSFQHLAEIPLDILKIDRCFVQNIGKKNKQELIIIAIIDLANTLNLQVVAEGVETISQANFLNENGCTFSQGYLYAKPMSADDCDKFIGRCLNEGNKQLFREHNLKIN